MRQLVDHRQVGGIRDDDHERLALALVGHKPVAQHQIRWNRPELDAIADERARLSRLSELNVLQQLGILARTPIVLDAWAKGQPVLLQGVVYDVATGVLSPVVEAIGTAEAANRLLPKV